MGRCFIDWTTAVVDDGDRFYEGLIKFGLLFRLVLNHLGYFNPSALKESLTSAVPRVVALSSDQDDFGRDLNSIDEISAKTGVLQTQFHLHFMTFKVFLVLLIKIKKDPNNAVCKHTWLKKQLTTFSFTTSRMARSTRTTSSKT